MAKKKRVSDDAVRDAVGRMADRPGVAEPDFTNALSTGSTLLNLAVTGRPDAGWVPGFIYHFVGDSGSGKSYVCLSSFAEAARTPWYDGHRLVYDDPEHGAQMDLIAHFGRKMAARLEPPDRTAEGLPRSSELCEDFWFHVRRLAAAGPVVYVLDSMDALSSVAEQTDQAKVADAVEKRDRKRDKGDEAAPLDYVAGMSDGKAKVNNRMIRGIDNLLYATGGILVIISQAKPQLNSPVPGAKGYSGGTGLRYYSQVELMAAPEGKITRKVDGVNCHLGDWVRIRLTKNRFLGRLHQVSLPIYHSVGIDDTGSMVEWMCDEGFWKKDGAQVRAVDFDFAGTAEAVVQHVESNDLEPKLKEVVTRCWHEAAGRGAPVRKRRYE